MLYDCKLHFRLLGPAQRHLVMKSVLQACCRQGLCLFCAIHTLRTVDRGTVRRYHLVSDSSEVALDNRKW